MRTSYVPASISGWSLSATLVSGFGHEGHLGLVRILLAEDGGHADLVFLAALKVLEDNLWVDGLGTSGLPTDGIVEDVIDASAVPSGHI